MSDGDSFDGLPDSTGTGRDERTPLLTSAGAFVPPPAVSNHHHQQQQHHFSNSLANQHFQRHHREASDGLDLSMQSASTEHCAGGGAKHCHSDETDRRARYAASQVVAKRRLMIASGLCLVFMLGEIVGGAIANSLAIMTDAAHMLTDLASFLISLLALCLATRPPSRRMSFGWYRAEVLGALISVLLIWVVTGVLVYLAVHRVVNMEFEVEGKAMLITAGAGVAFNILMVLLLHQGHGSSSTPAAGAPSNAASASASVSVDGDSAAAKDDNCQQGELVSDLEPEPVDVELSDTTNIIVGGRSHGHSHEGHGHSHGGHGHSHGGHGHSHDEGPGHGGFGHNHSHSNMNVRAAFIHVVGDLLQSLGVLVAAFIIYYRPDYKLADPICTFVFSVLVIGTTVSILRDTLRVLLEATPQGIDMVTLRSSLASLPGVVQVHSLRVWSLTLGRNALSAHLAIHSDVTVDRDQLVVMATQLTKSVYHISEVVFQVEPYVPEMDNCEHCLAPV